MADKRTPASLGKRLLPAVAVTTAASGLVAVLDHPYGGASAKAGAGSGIVLPGRRASTGGTAQPDVSSTLPPATPAASGGCSGTTVDGQTIDTRWGPVQVEAVMTASKQLCDVRAIQSPNSHRRSVQINNIALPILHQQVMDAQGLNINGVSGATITSIGYYESLQSILDGTA